MIFETTQENYLIIYGWMWFVYGNYHTKPAFHNLRSMMHSWWRLGDSGVENDTFFDRKLTHFDIIFQASFLMLFWLTFTKRCPKWAPKANSLKLFWHFGSRKCELWASWATFWPHGPLWVILDRFGVRFGSMLGSFWCNVGVIVLPCWMF